MDNTLIIAIFVLLLILLLVNIAIVFFFFKKLKNQEKPDEGGGLRLILDQINDLSRTVDSKVSSQFVESQKLIRETNEQMTRQLVDVAKGMTEATETGKQVLTITDQLRNLEKVLKHQKQRGSLGEASLELILSNILPPTSYKTQYSFPDGDKVDAVVMTKEGFIPVDAKFSLDNYNRIINESDDVRKSELEEEFKKDLKKRIDETSKYIRPKDGTLPFAFMFIPAEGIYYDLLVNEIGSVKVNTRSLIDYAYNEKKVIIVSPTTFAAYLQSVLYGFKAFKIQEDVKDIIKRVGELDRHLNSYNQHMLSMGKSLSTTVNHYERAANELKKIDKDVLRITGESSGIEINSVDRPKIED